MFWIIPKGVKNVDAWLSGVGNPYYVPKIRKQSTVHRYVKKLTKKSRDARLQIFKEKHAVKIEMFKNGMTLQQVGNEFGVTREYIRQILSKCGVDQFEGGRTIRGFLNIDNKVEKVKLKKTLAEQLCFEKYGCTIDFKKSLGSSSDKNSPVYKFSQQRSHAKKCRGIEWALTLPEWWDIWQSSGHWENRGRGIGKYAMTRICDSGGYTKNNVIIKSNVDNIREARDMDAVRGRWNVVEYDGITYRSLNRLCSELNISAQTIGNRIKRGMTLTEAVEKSLKG